MTVGDRIRQARLEQDVTQQELADNIGVSKQAVYKYENNIVTNIPTDKVDAIAKRLRVSPAYLMGWEEQPAPAASKEPTIPPGFEPMPAMDVVPLVGRIACGTPITAEENIEQMVCVPSRWHSTFTLTCKGDSMEPRISDGDLALVHRQNTLDNGDLGVLVYGADGEGTLKKYIQRGNSVILHPFNPAYEEMVIKGEDLDHLYIAGKVVETKAKW